MARDGCLVARVCELVLAGADVDRIDKHAGNTQMNSRHREVWVCRIRNHLECNEPKWVLPVRPEGATVTSSSDETNPAATGNDDADDSAGSDTGEARPDSPPPEGTGSPDDALPPPE